MEQKKFDKLYEEITNELIEFMEEEKGLNPDNFDSYLNEITVKVRVKIMLLGQELLTAEQVCKLMHIPDEVMLKITGLKK